MAGLQRSEISFRRSGSSGLVWDDKLITAELDKKANGDGEEVDREKAEESEAVAGIMERSRSNREQQQRPAGPVAYKAMKVSSPTVDPPSPKVSAGCCGGVFGKPRTARRRHKFGKRRSSS